MLITMHKESMDLCLERVDASTSHQPREGRSQLAAIASDSGLVSPRCSETPFLAAKEHNTNKDNHHTNHRTQRVNLVRAGLSR